MEQRNNIQPPKLADHFFEWYCRNELQESIQGDLHEEFFSEVESLGPFKAKVKYWLNVIRFINRHTLRRKSSESHYHLTSISMLKNYILVTLRSLKKNLVFSSINITGLAIGLASCIIIFFYVHNELNFDNFHSKQDRIYRVTNSYERASGTIHWARTPPALAPAIRTSISGVERVTRLRHADDHTYSVGENIFTEEDVFYADSSYLEIFDFNMTSGDKSTALDAPNSIVITEEVAKKYFGSASPLGKSILFDNSLNLQVTGVIEGVPTNSHIEFDFLISFSTYVVPDGYLADLSSWNWAGFWTYVEIAPNAEPEAVRNSISKLYDRDDRATNLSINIEVQPLKDIYLESAKYSSIGGSIRIGSKPTIYILIVISGLVLLLAGFNFTNLSTAISLNRGKEIGVRKVLGAIRGKVASQFIIESIIFTLVSLLLAVLIVWISRPYFINEIGIEMPGDFYEYLRFFPLFFLVTIIIGLLAGAYPAFILSKYRPVQALKGSLKTSNSGKWLTKSLTVFQFVVSIGLITLSIIIVAQMSYIKDRSLGFDKENVVKMRIPRDYMENQFDVMKAALLQNPRILHVSKTSHGFDGGSGSGSARILGEDSEEGRQLAYYQAGYDFLKVMDIQLLEGRFFSEDFASDEETALVLNESSVRDLGLVDPIGTEIRFNNRDRTVIGVVKDFNYASLHNEIAPMGIVMPFAVPDLVVIKVAPGPIGGLITSTQSTWNELELNSPFNITFLDDTIQKMYEKEEKLSRLITLFSILTVLLGCLGLYGLVSFSIQARLKEVGIRKTHGASINQILYLLTRQFLGLIVVANLISWPLTYFFANEWLNNFSYRIGIEWWMFVASGMLLLLIAMLTVSGQAIKTALLNPITILRTD